MTLHYHVSKDDYLHYCMYNYDHNAAIAKHILFLRLLYGGVILLASLVILIFSLSSYPLLYVAILWIMSAFLIAGTRRSIRKTNEKMYRKQIETGNGSEFIGDYTLELLDDRLIVSHSSRKSEIGYDSVVGVEQDEYSIYVFCGSLSAVILPLTAFDNKQQKSTFMNFLKDKCRHPAAV